jgi:hypothetical protein
LTGIVLASKRLIPNRTLAEAVELFLKTPAPRPLIVPTTHVASPPLQFQKGDMVEHFREQDRLVRAGLVLDVHCEDESVYYTVILDGSAQELQAPAHKLMLPGEWQRRLRQEGHRFEPGDTVEHVGSTVRIGTVLRVHMDDVVEGFRYAVRLEGEKGLEIDAVERKLRDVRGAPPRQPGGVRDEQAAPNRQRRTEPLPATTEGSWLDPALRTAEQLYEYYVAGMAGEHRFGRRGSEGAGE